MLPNKVTYSTSSFKGQRPLTQPTTIVLVKEQFDYISDEQLEDGREFIQLDTQSIDELEIGKTFQLALTSGGLVYTGEIDNIDGFENIKRLTGHFTELSGDKINQFSMTITNAGQYVIGNFSTQVGSFSLEAKNGVGWINSAENEMPYLLESESQHQIH